MIKTIHLQVTLKFSNKGIKNRSEQAVIEKVIDALINHADNVGISPYGENCHTEQISVGKPYNVGNMRRTAVLKNCAFEILTPKELFTLLKEEYAEGNK